MKTLQAVQSSNIEAIGFEEVLVIRFRGGKTFAYAGPKVKAHYHALLAADSIGKYFASVVRRCPETTCTRVEFEIEIEGMPDESLIPKLEASLR